MGGLSLLLSQVVLIYTPLILLAQITMLNINLVVEFFVCFGFVWFWLLTMTSKHDPSISCSTQSRTNDLSTTGRKTDCIIVETIVQACLVLLYFTGVALSMN